MNLHRLKTAEAAFLSEFPGGFNNPGPAMQRILRIHNVDQLATFTHANVTEATLSQPQLFADTLLKIMSRSSMVSRFEKPLFKSFLGGLSTKHTRALAEAFRKRLSGRQKREGFEEIVALFSRHSVARWSFVSALPFYFAPTKEAFVKPMAAKKIVALLEMDDLRYHARPDWAFYNGYRKLILEIRKHVDPDLAPHNAAITGFLMSAVQAPPSVAGTPRPSSPRWRAR